MNKRIIAIIFFIMINVSLLICILSILIIRKDKSDEKEYNNEHHYITTIITEKQINKGNGQFFFYGYYWMSFTDNPEYVVISQETKNDKTKTWTTVVDKNVFDSLSVGDILTICDGHDCPKIYEK